MFFYFIFLKYNIIVNDNIITQEDTGEGVGPCYWLEESMSTVVP